MLNKLNPQYYMQLAINQALQNPNYPFGAVIVNRENHEIVATGVNQASQNPILHGEMVAINHCANNNAILNWQMFDLYTTAEPCAMCQSAILWAGIGKVYYGTSIAYLQQQGWQQINIYAAEVIAKSPFRQCELIAGILEKECNALFDAAIINATHNRYFNAIT